MTDPRKSRSAPVNEHCTNCSFKVTQQVLNFPRRYQAFISFLTITKPVDELLSLVIYPWESLDGDLKIQKTKGIKRARVRMISENTRIACNEDVLVPGSL